MTSSSTELLVSCALAIPLTHNRPPMTDSIPRCDIFMRTPVRTTDIRRIFMYGIDDRSAVAIDGMNSSAPQQQPETRPQVGIYVCLNPPPFGGGFEVWLRPETELCLDAIHAWRGRRDGERAHAPRGLRRAHRFVAFVIEHVAHEA